MSDNARSFVLRSTTFPHARLVLSRDIGSAENESRADAAVVERFPKTWRAASYPHHGVGATLREVPRADELGVGDILRRVPRAAPVLMDFVFILLAHSFLTSNLL